MDTKRSFVKKSKSYSSINPLPLEHLPWSPTQNDISKSALKPLNSPPFQSEVKKWYSSLSIEERMNLFTIEDQSFCEMIYAMNAKLQRHGVGFFFDIVESSIAPTPSHRSRSRSFHDSPKKKSSTLNMELDGALNRFLKSDGIPVGSIEKWISTMKRRSLPIQRRNPTNLFHVLYEPFCFKNLGLRHNLQITDQHTLTCEEEFIEAIQLSHTSTYLDTFHLKREFLENEDRFFKAMQRITRGRFLKHRTLEKGKVLWTQEMSYYTMATWTSIRIEHVLVTEYHNWLKRKGKVQVKSKIPWDLINSVHSYWTTLALEKKYHVCIKIQKNWMAYMKSMEDHETILLFMYKYQHVFGQFVKNSAKKNMTTMEWFNTFYSTSLKDYGSLEDIIIRRIGHIIENEYKNQILKDLIWEDEKKMKPSNRKKKSKKKGSTSKNGRKERTKNDKVESKGIVQNKENIERDIKENTERDIKENTERDIKENTERDIKENIERDIKENLQRDNLQRDIIDITHVDNTCSTHKESSLKSPDTIHNHSIDAFEVDHDLSLPLELGNSTINSQNSTTPHHSHSFNHSTHTCPKQRSRSVTRVSSLKVKSKTHSENSSSVIKVFNKKKLWKDDSMTPPSRPSISVAGTKDDSILHRLSFVDKRQDRKIEERSFKKKSNDLKERGIEDKSLHRETIKPIYLDEKSSSIHDKSSNNPDPSNGNEFSISSRGEKTLKCEDSSLCNPHPKSKVANESVSNHTVHHTLKDSKPTRFDVKNHFKSNAHGPKIRYFDDIHILNDDKPDYSSLFRARDDSSLGRERVRTYKYPMPKNVYIDGIQPKSSLLKEDVGKHHVFHVSDPKTSYHASYNNRKHHENKEESRSRYNGKSLSPKSSRKYRPPSSTNIDIPSHDSHRFVKHRRYQDKRDPLCESPYYSTSLTDTFPTKEISYDSYYTSNSLKDDSMGYFIYTPVHTYMRSSINSIASNGSSTEEFPMEELDEYALSTNSSSMSFESQNHYLPPRQGRINDDVGEMMQHSLNTLRQPFMHPFDRDTDPESLDSILFQPIPEYVYYPLQERSEIHCQSLTAAIRKFLYDMEHFSVSHAVYYDELIHKMGRIVKNIWPNAVLDTYGSYSTQLMIPSSDIDILIQYIDSELFEADFERSTIKAAFQRLESVLRSQSWVQNDSILCVDQANVPVLKFRTNRNIWVDVTIKLPNIHHTGFESKQLIMHYMGLYPNMRYIILILKYLLSQHNLNQTFHGGLSSYYLTLMTISFFQLYERRYIRKNQIASCFRKNMNHLGLLLLDFLELYGVHMDYNHVKISIQDGGSHKKIREGEVSKEIEQMIRMTPGMETQDRSNYIQPYPLTIEDPLNPSKWIGGQVTSMWKVKMAMGNAYRILNETYYQKKQEEASLESIINNVFFENQK